MNAQLLDQLTQAISYRQLQTALKSAKNSGHQIACKLNATKEDLQVARNTLVAKLNAEISDQKWEDEILASMAIKPVMTDSEEQFIDSITAEFVGIKPFDKGLYEATKAILIEVQAPLDLVEQAAKIIASDNPNLENLGRTKEDQAIIWEAFPYFLEVAA